MVHNSYEVEESIGTVAILLKRSGDITKNITIYCYTIQGYFINHIVLMNE